MPGTALSWTQNYDPLGSQILSTAVSALPILALLLGIAVFRLRTHVAALLALVLALGLAIGIYRMPAGMAGSAALFGAANGLLPIGWLVLNILFLYRLTVRSGQFSALERQVSAITPDRRLQLLLIAFCAGAFFEGCAGFGAPVAITGAMLVGLGFAPISAARLSLIANTAPVAFGSLGLPILALSSVTGLPLLELSAMVGRQLPFFSFLVPFWLILAFAGWRGMVEIWPAILVTALSFAVPQFLVSNFHGPWLVDMVSAVSAIGALTLFLRHWRPRRTWTATEGREESPATVEAGGAAAGAKEAGEAPAPDHGARTDGPWYRAWAPWAILALCVALWGMPGTKAFLDTLFSLPVPVPGLDALVLRVPPVVDSPMAEAAVYAFSPLSTAGTGILLAAVIAGLVMGLRPRDLVSVYGQTVRLALLPLATIAVMLALGYVTRYSGADTVLGLALAQSAMLYPFFGTMVGWLGVAATGSDTASNVLFGGLQRTTAERIGISPVLMAAANSSGGVMGKMIDAQSIVVAATATGIRGREADILRYVFFHSVALAVLVGVLVFGQAYVWPLTAMVVGQ